MQMEFNPIDAIIPAGEQITVTLTESGEDYLPSPCINNPLHSLSVNIDGSSTLSLPLIERANDAPEWFNVPPWWESVEE